MKICRRVLPYCSPLQTFTKRWQQFWRCQNISRDCIFLSQSRAVHSLHLAGLQKNSQSRSFAGELDHPTMMSLHETYLHSRQHYDLIDWRGSCGIGGVNLLPSPLFTLIHGSFSFFADSLAGASDICDGPDKVGTSTPTSILRPDCSITLSRPPTYDNNIATWLDHA